MSLGLTMEDRNDRIYFALLENRAAQEARRGYSME